MAETVASKKTKKVTARPRREKKVVVEKVEVARKSPVGRFFGEALRKMREAKSVLLRDLADHLDVSLPYLSDVERGQREPLSNDRIKQAADFLDGDPLHLIEEAIRDRGHVKLPIDKGDSLRVRAAMMLVLKFHDVTDDAVSKIVNILRAAS